MNNRTILLADDHPLVRSGLKSVLEILNAGDKILEAGNGLEVLLMSQKTPVDLFILDFKMPEMNGYDTARILLKRNPRTKIIIISMYDDTALIVNLLRLGVSGFLTKNTGIDEIELAVARVLAGDIYYNQQIESCIQKELSGMRAQPLSFTDRESELITMLTAGKTSKEIAEVWGLTLKTIETYRSRLLDKAGVRNTSELLHYLHKNGLVA